MLSLKATLLQLLFSLFLFLSFKRKCVGTDMRLRHVCFFFLKEDYLPLKSSKSLGHVYWLVTLPQAFREILGKLWLFSGDKWSDCRSQTCSAETSTHTFRHQVPSTVIPSSICGQCPPMTPCMLILKADFWTWELKIPILWGQYEIQEYVILKWYF